MVVVFVVDPGVFVFAGRYSGSRLAISHDGFWGYSDLKAWMC